MSTDIVALRGDGAPETVLGAGAKPVLAGVAPPALDGVPEDGADDTVAGVEVEAEAVEAVDDRG